MLLGEHVYDKIIKLENIPENLRIHLLYIWSDGFQKNMLVKTKKTSLQLFIVYVVPPDGVRDIAKYTFPFALGKKQKGSPSSSFGNITTDKRIGTNNISILQGYKFMQARLL